MQKAFNTWRRRHDISLCAMKLKPRLLFFSVLLFLQVVLVFRLQTHISGEFYGPAYTYMSSYGRAPCDNTACWSHFHSYSSWLFTFDFHRCLEERVRLTKIHSPCCWFDWLLLHDLWSRVACVLVKPRHNCQPVRLKIVGIPISSELWEVIARNPLKGLPHACENSN